MVSYNFLYNFLLIYTLTLSVLNTDEVSRNSVRQLRRSCASNLLNNIFRLCPKFKVEKGYITEKTRERNFPVTLLIYNYEQFNRISDGPYFEFFHGFNSSNFKTYCQKARPTKGQTQLKK